MAEETGPPNIMVAGRMLFGLLIVHLMRVNLVGAQGRALGMKAGSREEEKCLKQTTGNTSLPI
jgi:hypothetical protein